MTPGSSAAEALTAYYSSAGRGVRAAMGSGVASRRQLPSPADFLARHTALGTTGRRLAAMDRAAQTALLRRVQARLAKLAAEDFFNESEVIAATAFAR